MVRRAAYALLFVALAILPAAAQEGAKNTLTLETTKGVIVIRLRSDLAPKHAERLTTLAREKFYDNVPFHRVIAGFMAQTGDGQFGNGMGGSKYPDLPAEFSKVLFKRGIVGMARKPTGVDTANSQFFIMFGDAPGLNGQYTVIGEVASGMDVVDRLNKGSGEGGVVANPDKIVRATAGGS
jgi:peptidylprolyl isomerase